eukprot:CAMPEP_0172813656 /NCGR_PEP_ID=MMETSP1075-20121228/10796_1 /TAXON_ID=2916 /ORGANISM="Ceratium fusus, Strain PA161109" /LENGTH=84 /DNA_ID=CAMNT_0013653383 /DNA_START=889 /DNA_END=1140 /DNA_ORIENTATION=-
MVCGLAKLQQPQVQHDTSPATSISSHAHPSHACNRTRCHKMCGMQAKMQQRILRSTVSVKVVQRLNRHDASALPFSTSPAAGKL